VTTKSHFGSRLINPALRINGNRAPKLVLKADLAVPRKRTQIRSRAKSALAHHREGGIGTTRPRPQRAIAMAALFDVINPTA